MKKISLILALMLVLTCGVFTACGGDEDTSSKAATSTASKADDSSVASEAESESESSAPEVSTPDSSEPETSTPDEKVEVTGEVISAGAAYTTQDLFRQNEAYEWDENSPIAYPDAGGEMTDGVFAPAEAHNLWMAELAGPWIGFHTMHPDYATDGCAWIIVDLGEAKDISGAKIYSAGTSVDGAVIDAVTVFVSNDGENWEEFGKATVDNSGTATVVETAVAGTANAQYVKYTFTSSAYWMAICEVEVLGGSAAVEDTSDASDASDTSVAE